MFKGQNSLFTISKILRSSWGEFVVHFDGNTQLGYTLEMWHRTVSNLATRYRTIIFDNRGVGKSDIPAGPYLIATMAEDALAILDAAEIESAHVFGISMGGLIAQELALQHPDRVRSLILGCTHCGGAEAMPASSEVLEVLTARAKMTPEEGVWALVPYIYDPSTPRERVKEDLTIRLRTFPTKEGYLAQLQGIMEWGSHSRLGSIRIPTLVIHGEHDQLVPPANAEIFAQAIPNARLIVLPNASHIFFTDQPAVSNLAIQSFLSER